VIDIAWAFLGGAVSASAGAVLAGALLSRWAFIRGYRLGVVVARRDGRAQLSADVRALAAEVAALRAASESA